MPRRTIGSCSSNLVTKSLASSGGASSSLGHSITPLMKATKKNYRSVRVVGSILRDGKDQRKIINDWYVWGARMFYSFLQFPSALFSSILMYGGKALRGARGGGGRGRYATKSVCLFVCLSACAQTSREWETIRRWQTTSCVWILVSNNKQTSNCSRHLELKYSIFLN